MGFRKNVDGEEGRWEGVKGHQRGLDAVIDMTDENWREELRKYDDFEGEGSEEEDEMGQEEAEDPGL